MSDTHQIRPISRRPSWSRPRAVLVSLCAQLVIGSTFAVWALISDLSVVSKLERPAAEHANQDALNALVAGGQNDVAFKTAFAQGNELFETVFNALDGVGANVGDGQRFTRVPRADLTRAGEWATHIPPRATGPNAASCLSCHNTPSDDGAGSAAANVHRDPFHTARLGQFIQRNTPHLFGLGATQRLAEEMTDTLQSIRDGAVATTCQTGKPVTVALSAKGVDYGKITVKRNGVAPCMVDTDTSALHGIDADLIVKPFQWKGSVAFIRAFNRDAANNEIGMQAVELVGHDVDGDGDGVINEMTIGDMTSLAIYMAAQARPTTRTELAALGLLPALSKDEVQSINRGSLLFQKARCTACHLPYLTIKQPIFTEPSQNKHYRDQLFPAGQNPVSLGVNPASAIAFDLTRDQPDNVIKDAAGNVTFRLGAFQKDTGGGAIVELFGDLKRHDMGPDLAESIDEVGTGASVFLTRNLWGVGSTAPYLHDGRATTLVEAVLYHGGDAADSRAAFLHLPPDAQQDLMAFLKNLVLFRIPGQN